MLGLLKQNLASIFLPTIYLGGYVVMLFSALKDVKWGLYLLIALIPQPNIWFKFQTFPLGKDFMDYLYLAILVGCFLQKKSFARTGNSTLILIFVIISYIALWNSSLRFSLPLPISHANHLLYNWKNYAQMILIYFFVLNIIKDEDHQKLLVVIMSVVILFIAIRAFRGFSGGQTFHDDRRLGGPFEVVLLGSNHFGAFIAYSCAMFLALFFFDKDWRRRCLFLITYLFGLHPLFFAYSRGAYAACFSALIFFGIAKKKILLVIIVTILLSWKAILPTSVIDRITMTEDKNGQLEHSSAVRLELWQEAYEYFEKHPVFGLGFGGFSLAVKNRQFLTDTHNFFLKTLCEQGIIGAALLLLVLYKALRSGWILFRKATSPFNQGLGFGFMGCVIAMIVTNMFGDRWSYFVLGSYFWIFWGLVDRGILLSVGRASRKLNDKTVKNICRT